MGGVDTVGKIVVKGVDDTVKKVKAMVKAGSLWESKGKDSRDIGFKGTKPSTG